MSRKSTANQTAARGLRHSSVTSGLPEKARKRTRAAHDMLGLYCHVPFCASSCDFCSFYQEKPKRAQLLRYLGAMEREFALLPADRRIDTVFWGGGTPGLLSADDLKRLGEAMLARMPAAPCEWTVEMAPSTVKTDKLEVLRALGVTRISMGAQSFDAGLLEGLGRLHNRSQIETAWERILAAGFPQTNLDMIFAIPGQTLEQWQTDLHEAIRMGPDHISTYCLTFEEDTALYVKLSEGKVTRDEAKELSFYENAWEQLGTAGYAQYEISNFARPGAACLHNTNTWRMEEWIGCGPSAASQFAGERYQRPSDLDAWAAGMEAGRPLRLERVALDNRLLFSDALLFGLRMNAGVDLAELQQRFPDAGALERLEPCLRRFEEAGHLHRDGTELRLTHSGRLLCDGIGAEILAAC